MAAENKENLGGAIRRTTFDFSLNQINAFDRQTLHAQSMFDNSDAMKNASLQIDDSSIQVFLSPSATMENTSIFKSNDFLVREFMKAQINKCHLRRHRHKWRSILNHHQHRQVGRRGKWQRR